MKSPSDKNRPPGSGAGHAVEKAVNRALDHSAANLTDKTLDDLYAARNAALRAMHNPAEKPNITRQMADYLTRPFTAVTVPVAAAVIIALSLEYGSVESIPALPVAALTEDVPTEDLSLLEDLEFVSWLAENEQESLL